LAVQLSPNQSKLTNLLDRALCQTAEFVPLEPAQTSAIGPAPVPVASGQP
jgi:hypothetical protein